MTKEQTISNLKKLKSFHNGSYGADIDRAIKALEQEPKIVPIAEIKFDDDMLHEIVEDAVKNIEIEPQTGHWKRISIDKYSEHAKYWYRCDRCGKDNLGNTDWCPNCGAKMVEPQESEVQE